MEINFGILILGDTNVGKTSLLLNYTDNYYVGSHVATVGIDFKFKTIKVKDMDVKLQIWDTSGQERFRSLAKNYLKKADGIIFVYDITDKKTFEGVKDWIKEAESQGIYKQILVGNKCDLERKVSKERIENFKKKNNLNIKFNYFETSALTGDGIDDCMLCVVDNINKLYEKNKDNINYNNVNNIQLNNKKDENKSGCFC
jgi:Ras-related protein Rab-1A